MGAGLSALTPGYPLVGASPGGEALTPGPSPGGRGEMPSPTGFSHASFQKKRQPRWHPSWKAPSQRSPSRKTFPPSKRIPAPSTHVFSARRKTRCRWPQKGTISGMKGMPSSLPSASRVARISSAGRMSTASPRRSGRSAVRGWLAGIRASCGHILRSQPAAGRIGENIAFTAARWNAGRRRGRSLRQASSRTTCW